MSCTEQLIRVMALFLVHVVFRLEVLVQGLVCISHLQGTATFVSGSRCVPAGSPQGVVCSIKSNLHVTCIANTLQEM